MTRRTWVLSALAAGICLTVAAAGALVVRGRGDVLAAEVNALVYETDDAQIGTSYDYALDGFTNTSPHRVTFLEVRPIAVSPGVVVDAIRAINNCPSPRMVVIGAKPGRIERTNPELPVHPVSDAVIDAHAQSCWYFLIAVRPTQLGPQAVRGFELVYRVNGRTERHRVPLGMELTVTGHGHDPRADERFPLYP